MYRINVLDENMYKTLINTLMLLQIFSSLQQILANNVIAHEVDEASVLALEIASSVLGHGVETTASRVRYLLCLIVLQHLRVTEHIDIALAGEGVHSVEDLAIRTQVC